MPRRRATAKTAAAKQAPVAAKQAPIAAKPSPNGAKQSPIEIVVRRGAIRRFDALKTRTSELPVVLTWDRRTDDRRERAAAASVKRDRRQNERRKSPPFTWDLADFVVVERGARRKKAGKKPSKKS